MRKLFVVTLLISVLGTTGAIAQRQDARQQARHSFSADGEMPAVPAPTQGIADGRELIAAMVDAYRGEWFERLMIEQEVTYYRDGQPGRTEVWTEWLLLPGKVRSVVGDPEDGDYEIYSEGTFYRFRGGELVSRLETIHPVLLLGFDIYLQDPQTTIDQLVGAGFDLDQLYEATWQERPVWVVGARPGDTNANQFWIDQQNLVYVRSIADSPGGGMVDVEMNALERVDGGWVATELVFRRDGELLISERYLRYEVPDHIDPELFTIPRSERRVP